MIARSRSENVFAARVAREPNAHASYYGAWRARMLRTISQSRGLRSMGGIASEVIPARFFR